MSTWAWRRTAIILSLLAIGGSAVGLAFWLGLLTRSADRDTYGLDGGALTAAADPAAAKTAPPSFLDLTSTEQPAVVPGHGKTHAGESVIGSARAESAARSAAAAKTSPGRREEAARAFREAAVKYEGLVENFIRRMEAKHPSLARYGQDWAASPELCAARDRYGEDRDPLKFAYTLAKSGDFHRLVKKYSRDPGVHDVILQGLKEAPPGLLSAAHEVLYTDKTVQGLASGVIKEVGLPANLTDVNSSANAAPPDPDKIVSDIMPPGPSPR